MPTVTELQWADVLPAYDASDAASYIATGETCVRFVAPANLAHIGGDIIRVQLATFWPGAIYKDPLGWNLGALWIGHQSDGGEPWEFDGGQVQLFFGGKPGMAVPVFEAPWSDPLMFNLQPGKPLIFSAVLNGQYAGQGNGFGWFPTIPVPADHYLCSDPGAAGNDSGAFVSDGGNNIRVAWIKQLQVAAGPLDIARQEVNWTGQGTAPAGVNIRVRIPKGAISTPAGTVRLRFGHTGTDYGITACSIGIAGEGGAFAGSPAAVLFGGGASTTITASDRVSDAVAIEADGSHDLLVALYLAGGGDLPRAIESGWGYSYALARGDETQTQDPAAYIQGGAWPLCLEALEWASSPAAPQVVTAWEVRGANAGQFKDAPAYRPLHAGSCFRIIFPARVAANPYALASCTQARLTMFWHDYPWTNGVADEDGDLRCWKAASLYIGFASRTGHLLAFEHAPVPVAFEGRSFPLKVDGPLVSDWLDLPRPWTPGDRLLVSLRLAGDYRLFHGAPAWGASWWGHWQADDSGEQTPAHTYLDPVAYDQTHPDYDNQTWAYDGCQPFVQRLELR